MRFPPLSTTISAIGLIHDSRQAGFQIVMQIIYLPGGNHWKTGKMRKIGSSKYFLKYILEFIIKHFL